MARDSAIATTGLLLIRPVPKMTHELAKRARSAAPGVAANYERIVEPPASVKPTPRASPEHNGAQTVVAEDENARRRGVRQSQAAGREPPAAHCLSVGEMPQHERMLVGRHRDADDPG